MRESLRMAKALADSTSIAPHGWTLYEILPSGESRRISPLSWLSAEIATRRMALCLAIPSMLAYHRPRIVLPVLTGLAGRAVLAVGRNRQPGKARRMARRRATRAQVRRTAAGQGSGDPRAKIVAKVASVATPARLTCR